MAKETETAASTTKEPKFSIDVLRKNCVPLFGCTTSTFDGATFGAPEKDYTVAEMKTLIDSWGKKIIKKEAHK